MLLWDAFWELGTERQNGMSIGPIPASKIREHLRDELGFCGVEYEHARAVIRKADSAYLAILNKRGGDDDVVETVKATDREGVKNLVRNLGNRYAGKPKTK